MACPRDPSAAAEPIVGGRRWPRRPTDDEMRARRSQSGPFGHGNDINKNRSTDNDDEWRIWDCGRKFEEIFLPWTRREPHIWDEKKNVLWVRLGQPANGCLYITLSAVPEGGWVMTKSALGLSKCFRRADLWQLAGCVIPYVRKGNADAYGFLVVLFFSLLRERFAHGRRAV